MGDTVKIDLGAMDQLHSDLARIAGEFRGADQVDSSLAEAVGEDTLKSAVHEFVAGWTKRRQKLLDSLDKVSAQADAIHDAFVDIDKGLADSLTKK